MAIYSKISEVEFELLEGMQYLHQLTYIYLRRRMNYKTFTVGQDDSRISYQGLCSRLFVNPKQGIKHSGSPSYSQIRTAVNELCKAGLLSNQSISTKDKKQLIFYFPYAEQFFCDQNKLRTLPKVGTSHAKKKNTNPNNSGESWGYEKQNVLRNEDLSTVENSDLRTYHNIIIKNKKNNIYKIPTEIPQGFCPSDELINKAKSMGLDNVDNLIEIQNFINYHFVKDTKESDWNEKYLGWLINGRKIKQQYASNARRSSYESSKQSKRPMSEIDRVREAHSWIGRTEIIEHE